MRDGRPAGPPQLLQRDIGVVIDLVGVTASGAFHYNRRVGLVDEQVLALDADGRPRGQPRATTGTDVGGNLMPAFSADGQRVTYASRYATGATLHHFDLSARTVRRVVVSLLYVRVPRWSPDGLTLVVRGSSRDGRAGFFKVDPDSGHATAFVTVPSNEETSLGPGSWRHDGRFLFVRNPNRLTMTSLGEGGEAPCGISSNSAHRTSCCRWWMPDGDSLLFSRRTETDRRGTLWRVGASGGTPEPLGIEAEGLRDLAISPDAKHVAFTAGSPRREPWVIEHVLPPPYAWERRTPNEGRTPHAECHRHFAHSTAVPVLVET